MNMVEATSAPSRLDRACLAVFTSRESLEVLSDTVAAVVKAAPGYVDLVDVLVNGNPKLARQLVSRVSGFVKDESLLRLRVWQFALGDKAHTWNEYIERIVPTGRDCFFIDGYAAVQPDALRIMSRSIATLGHGLAVTGVPTLGLGARGMARQMLAHGGIHGNLFALPGATIQQIRGLGFRLPLGLYRTDATIGAALALGLDLQERHWDPLSRIRVCPDAHWKIRPLRWWHPADLRTHWRRYKRQAQGSLENAAVRYRFHIRQEHFGALPRTAAELVSAWAREVPAEFEAVLSSRRFARDAYERMMAPRDWRAADEAPEVLADTHSANQGQA